MRLWVMIVAGAVALAPGRAPAQVVAAAGGVPVPTRLNGYFSAPGYYGMSYGVPSYGSIRTYSEFSSPYGAGYGYGYAPYGLLPGRYGVGLWRPAFAAPGYVYGASYYQTFAVPYVPGSTAPLPPVGLYAPGFGPPSFNVW